MAEKFLQNADIVEGWVIVDLQTGANSGDWVSLKNYHNAVVKFHSAPGTAAE